MPIYDRSFAAPHEPTAFERTVNCADLTALQAACAAALPGDKIVLATGTHTGTSHTPAGGETCLVDLSRSGTAAKPITIEGADDLCIVDGENTKERFLFTDKVKHVVIRDITAKRFTRPAIEITCPRGQQGASTNVLVARVVVLDSGFHGAYGGVRFKGPITDSVMRYVLCYRCGIGPEFREAGAPLTKDTAQVPPVAGNIDYQQFTSESTYEQFRGWVDYGPVRCRMERCVGFASGALNFNGQQPTKDSDTIYMRYSSACVADECIGSYGGDDNFDFVACCDVEVKFCVAINGGYKTDGTRYPEGGNGCGFKMGARGGLRHRLIGNVALWNRQAGIDTADCVYPTIFRNTCAWNQNGGNSYGIGMAPKRTSWPDDAHPRSGCTLAMNLAWKNALNSTEDRPQLYIDGPDRIVRTGCYSNYASDDGSKNFNIPLMYRNYYALRVGTTFALPFATDHTTRQLPALPLLAEMIPSNMVKLWNDTHTLYTGYIARATPATVPAAVGAPL